MNEKLVRDKMPELCANTPGWTPMTVRVASTEERITLLIHKLKEEVQELNAAIHDPSGNWADMIEEFADVKQVYIDLISFSCANEQHIEDVRRKKLEHRGGFTQFYVWDGRK